MGVPFGTDGIYATKTRHKKYYLTEIKRNLRMLSNMQNNSFMKQKDREGGIR